MDGVDPIDGSSLPLGGMPGERGEMSDFWNKIKVEMERLCPASLAARLDRERPYDGQPHTDEGQRGQQEVHGVTMRDLTDCYVRACYDASGLSPSDWPGSVYDLPWDDMDPLAIMQNLTCWVERYMGVYPNLGEFQIVDDPMVEP